MINPFIKFKFIKQYFITKLFFNIARSKIARVRSLQQRPWVQSYCLLRVQVHFDIRIIQYD